MKDSVHVPVPCKGEVLVRVRAASINPGEWKVHSGGPHPLPAAPLPGHRWCIRAGLIPFLPRRFPATA
ncbi:unnamed protein product, partial [Closterium sp. Naga37s-1]